jgi:putative two-component system response regulator
MRLNSKQADLVAKQATRRLVEVQFEVLERLAVTADLREDASGEHGYRVGRLSALLAKDLGWDKDACLSIDLAARLHDIGKTAVPDHILLTSEALKEAERKIMRQHTLFGAELLAKSDIPQVRMAEEIAHWHHEWWNGSGYPNNLKGKRIPVHARIVALADVFDAMTHGRPYEQAWPVERAIEQIRMLRGEQFDPDLTDIFLAMIERLARAHEDLDAYLGKASRNSPLLQARQKIRRMLAEGDDQDPPPPSHKGNSTRH